MSDQISAVADVLREHFQNATTWESEEKEVGWRCTCGQRAAGDHRDHMAEMLALAGLVKGIESAKVSTTGKLIIKGGTMTSIAGVRAASPEASEDSILNSPSSRVGRSRYDFN